MAAPAARPAIPRRIVIMGHSIANGVGQADAVYGGVALPSGVQVRDSGTDLSAWPNNAGAGPDPGILPRLVQEIRAEAPDASLQIIRESTNGQIVSGVQATELVDAIREQLELGWADPDLVILMIGENDAQNSTESAAYATAIPRVLELIRIRWPDSRIIIQDMVSENSASYGEFAVIRAANAAAVAGSQVWAVAPYTGITLNDAVHYDSAGFATSAANIWATWKGLP